MTPLEIGLLVTFGWLGLSALAGLVWITLAELRRYRAAKAQYNADAAELHNVAEFIRHRRQAADLLARWAQEYGR